MPNKKNNNEMSKKLLEVISKVVKYVDAVDTQKKSENNN